MIKQSTKKKPVKKADTSDLQAPIDVAPESAMQEKPPFITQDIEVVRETAPKPDPDFIPRIPHRNPNGNPFDTMYARQRKAR
jgi:hypothetical protein